MRNISDEIVMLSVEESMALKARESVDKVIALAEEMEKIKNSKSEIERALVASYANPCVGKYGFRCRTMHVISKAWWAVSAAVISGLTLALAAFFGNPGAPTMLSFILLCGLKIVDNFFNENRVSRRVFRMFNGVAQNLYMDRLDRYISGEKLKYKEEIKQYCIEHSNLFTAK